MPGLVGDRVSDRASANEPPRRLDARSLKRGVAQLAATDPDLSDIVRRHGPPPLWARPEGMRTLIRIVLEQQVSLASGRAVYGRLEDHLGEVTAEAIMESGVSGLRRIGLTRQKAAYCVEVAERIESGELDLRRVAKSSEEAARRELRRVKGVGPWTADIYLLMALRRPDIWPSGDVALLTALQRLRGQPERPTVEEAAEEALGWAPWRAVAARILWHGYLAGSLSARGGAG